MHEPGSLRHIEPLDRPKSIALCGDGPEFHPGRRLDPPRGDRPKEGEAPPGLAPLKPDRKHSQPSGQGHQAEHEPAAGGCGPPARDRSPGSLLIHQPPVPFSGSAHPASSEGVCFMIPAWISQPSPTIVC